MPTPSETEQLIAQMSALTSAIHSLVQSNTEVMAALIECMDADGDTLEGGCEFLEDLPAKFD